MHLHLLMAIAHACFCEYSLITGGKTQFPAPLANPLPSSSEQPDYGLSIPNLLTRIKRFGLHNIPPWLSAPPPFGPSIALPFPPRISGRRRSRDRAPSALCLR